MKKDRTEFRRAKDTLLAVMRKAESGEDLSYLDKSNAIEALDEILSIKHD